MFNRSGLPLATTQRGRLSFTLAAAAILVLAATLRFYALDFADVRFDEASALQQALAISQGHLQLLANFSGSVLNHPPAYLYLMALPYLLTRDLLAVLAFRVGLDVLAIGLCMLACQRHFGQRMALLAGVLFATAPWAIQFSRNTGIVVVPLLGALIVLGLLEAINQRRAWGWALAFGGAALAVASHWSGVYWLIVVVMCAIVWRRALSLRHMLMGLGVLGVFAAAYIAGDAAKNFENLRRVLSQGTQSVGFAINLQVLNVALWSSGGTRIGDLAGQAYTEWAAQTPLLTNWIEAVQIALLVIGVAVAIALGTVWRKRVDARLANGAAILAIGWCVPVLIQMIGARPIAMHYLLPLYPLPFMLMALAANQGLRLAAARVPAKFAPLLMAAVAVVPLIIAGWQALTWVRLVNFVETHDTSQGGYGAPVRSLLQAGQLARAAQRDGLDEVIVIIKGDTQPWNESPVVAAMGLSNVPHRFLNIENDGLIFRPQGTHYIIAPSADGALARIDELFGGDVVSQALPMRLSGAQPGYTYVRTGPLATARFAPASATWQSGIALAGVRYSLSGTSLAFQTLMTVTQTPPANANFHWFNHVYAAGNKIAQTDGQGVHPYYWHAGDQIVMEWGFVLPQADPPLPLVMRMGSYTFPEPHRVPVTLSYGKETNEVDVALREP